MNKETLAIREDCERLLIDATLEEKYKLECDYSNLLGDLLNILYGEGWSNLTLSDAEIWRKKHFSQIKGG